mmetsp:Transcript_138147/g.240169  ORF Transcript_138147/g.240169 Transcript_138147/m.240169 type:complete len:92 (-) Transcript_138147:1482-1757(-)
MLPQQWTGLSRTEVDSLLLLLWPSGGNGPHTIAEWIYLCVVNAVQAARAAASSASFLLTAGPPVKVMVLLDQESGALPSLVYVRCTVATHW